MADNVAIHNNDDGGNISRKNRSNGNSYGHCDGVVIKVKLTINGRFTVDISHDRLVMRFSRIKDSGPQLGMVLFSRFGGKQRGGPVKSLQAKSAGKLLK